MTTSHGTSWRTGRAAFAIQVIATLGLLWMSARIIAAFGSPESGALLPFQLDTLSSSSLHHLLWIPLLLALAVPAALSIPRLSDAGYPTPLAALAVIPVVNLGVLVWFALLPSRELRVGDRTPLDAWLPHGRFGSAAMGVAAGALLGAVAAGLAAVTGGYGALLFLGAPFAMGVVAAWVVGYRLPAPVPMKICLSAALLSVGLCAILIVAVAIEGVICVLMALPLALPMAAGGGFLGMVLANRTSKRRLQWTTLVLAPALFGTHPTQPPPVRSVHSAILIRAPQSRVWKAVVDQPPLPAPTEWTFRAGVGYPVRIDLPEAALGAVRRCQFSTGLVLERVDGLEPGHRLHFTIFQQGPLMRELSPYGIQPRHLEASYARSVAGEFVLTPLPDGTTRLETTSWYSSSYAPSPYWSLWMDGIVHDIHGRVLRAIRDSAEKTQVGRLER